jgi:hypothetical protein
MELDDFKTVWAQYDEKLTANLKLNQELLRKMNLNSSKKEMQKPLIYELIGVVVFSLLIIYVVAFSIRFINEPKYFIPGIISIVIGTVYLIFAIIRANKFLSLDYYSSSVLKLQKDMAVLKRSVLQFRKFEIILTPLLVLPLIPLGFKAVHNIDIYKNSILFSIEAILILSTSIPLYLWINKHMYDNKIKHTESLLKEIEKFESEE